MNSDEVTVTDARVLQGLKRVNSLLGDSTTSKQIKKEVDNAKLKTGVVNKYYMDLNKVEVTLNNDGSTVLCRVLQAFCGEFVIKYAPEGDYEWDSKLTAGYVVPRIKMNCVVLPTDNNEKSTDYFLIGYYHESDVPDYVKAPSMGNIKLSYISACDEYLVQFGYNGFNVISNHVNQYEGEQMEYARPIDDLASKETLTKDYYTREEVDQLIKDLKIELGVIEDDTTSEPE